VKVREPLSGNFACDRQQIVAMLERKISALAVAAITTEPLGEETLLSLAAILEITAEKRPQRRICFDPVVEPIAAAPPIRRKTLLSTSRRCASGCARNRRCSMSSCGLTLATRPMQGDADESADEQQGARGRLDKEAG